MLSIILIIRYCEGIVNVDCLNFVVWEQRQFFVGLYFRGISIAIYIFL